MICLQDIKNISFDARMILFYAKDEARLKQS
jgi:hypothetical protein